MIQRLRQVALLMVLGILSTRPFLCQCGKKAKIALHSIKAKGGGAITSWGFLGPFPIGKGEVDGDPTEEAPGGARGCARSFVQSGTKTFVFKSELVKRGAVNWKLLTAQTNGQLDLVVDDVVDWQSIVNGVGGHEVLEWQGLLVAQVKVDAAVTTRITCSGVGAFHIDPFDEFRPTIGPLAGNPYFGQEQVGATVRLNKGRYIIRVRPRVKHRGQIQCRYEAIGRDKDSLLRATLRSKFVPDWIRGNGPLGGRILIGCEFRNPTSKWIIPSVASVTPAVVKLDTTTRIPRVAPSQTALLTVTLTPTTSPSEGDCIEPFSMRFSMATEDGATVVARDVDFDLRCRSRGQSILVTFEDADGSVQQVALVHPPKSATCQLQGSLCPVLLTLHGTSISASDSADAFKMMKPGDTDYTFGFSEGWLLAPSRHGAHNWEGVGRRHALEATLWLAEVTAGSGGAANANQLIVAGHSMGGHGAWLFGVLEPGRTHCLNPNAGWLRKEQYGDSNTLFTHDLRLDTIDSRLKYILEASVAENMVDMSVANLDGGMQVLARVGSADKSVHPWYTRRMVRMALASGVNATLTELANKEHWWWDTKSPNDGGAVNDAQLRRFFRNCANGTPRPRKFRLVTVNPAATGAKFGLRVEQQIVPYQKASIQAKRDAHRWHLVTQNVRRFSVQGDEFSESFDVDGQVFDISARIGAATQCYCRVFSGGWGPCEIGPQMARRERGPHNYGPLRQVFESQYVIVFGTQAPSDDANRLATLALFIANLVHATGDGVARILPDTTPLGETASSHNVVFVGGAKWNRWARKLLPTEPSIRVLQTGVVVGNCSFSGPGIGVAALVPITNGERLGLLLDGVDIDGVTDIVGLATPTIPPMVRQPFTNTLPDYLVTSASIRSNGVGGLLAAGYWGNAWEFRQDTAYTVSCLASPTNDNRSNDARTEL